MSYSTVNQFYDGSNLLQPISSAAGIPIDQINFLGCQLFALFFGFPYRSFLGPHRTSSRVRHVVEIIVGVTLAYFCFGRQIIHILVQSLLCFVLMRTLEPGIMEKVVLAVAMLYLCGCHLNRMYYDYGGYTLDITGPLMLNTQRLSSLAFNLRDGREKDESKLTAMMKQLAVKNMPTVLESVSYIFCFHGLMCGPFCFYKDYIAFIEGENYKSSEQVLVMDSTNQVSTNNTNHRKSPPPAPGMALVQKLTTAAVFGISTVFIIPRFPPTLVTGDEFQYQNFLYKNFLIVFLTSLQRQKYYFAWKLGEAVNASCGLGFNGYDSNGRARWDLVDNADIWKIEFATSLKQLLDNWNMSTINWLRYIIYERYPSTMAVFAFSSCWHGFYAGYYMTFLSAGFFLNTARMARRRIRHFFQSSKQLALAYDFFTFLLTKISGSYVGFPFMILECLPCVTIYWNVYFWQHFMTAALFLVLVLTSSRAKKTP